jgi:putative ABC transport system permease protein
MSSFWQDVRFGFRILTTQGRFTLVAVILLALGVGTPTIVFSVVNATLLRPLPYHDPERLVAITSVFRAAGQPDTSAARVTLDEIERWRPEVGRISSMGAFAYTQIPIRVGNQAFSPVTALMDAHFLPTLEVPLAMGSWFADDPSAGQTAIISYRLWRAAFAADAGAIGRTFLVDGTPHVLRGVLGEHFQFPRADASYYPEAVDLLLPPSSIPGFPASARQWWGIARLAPGSTIADAVSELQGIARPSAAAETGDRAWLPVLAPLDQETTRTARQPLLILLGISAVLLLIAATNLMNLLFARGIARLREMAIRRAVGSSTLRIVRQMLTESLLLALAGGVAGLWITALTIRGLVSMSPVHLPVSGSVSIDWRVLLFSFGICVVASVAASLVPALYVSTRSRDAIRGAGLRGSAGGGVARIQRALCVAQIALGVALLTSAGLLANSLWTLASVDPGFRTERILGFNLSIPTGTSPETRSQFYARALEEVRSIPGVEQAGLISFLPPETRAGVFMGLAIEGAPPPAPGERPPVVNTLVASGSYFSTVDMRIVRGRNIEPSDRPETRPVILVNEALVRRWFAGVDPIGRRVGTGFDGLEPVREIVGVVADARDRGLGRAAIPTVYLPFEQFSLPYGSIAIRTATAADRIVPVIRERLARIDPAVPLTGFQMLNDRLGESLREPRFYTVIAAAAAILAVCFVTFGLYGLISYSVSRRTAELGLRIAVGADPRTILRMVLRQGLGLGVLGVSVGLALAALTTRWLESLLFGVQPLDALTFTTAAVIALVVTVAAAYGPARRASRVDPLVALRYE